MNDGGYPTNMGELYKRHRLSLEKEIGALGFSESADEDFEEFAGDIAEKLRINLDAVMGKRGYVINDNAARLAKGEKPALRRLRLDSGNEPYAKIMGRKADRSIVIEVGDGERKKMAIVFANMNAPLITETSIKLGKDAELELFEVFVSRASKPSLNLSMHEIELQKDSRLEMNTLHNEDKNTNAMHFRNAVVNEGGKFRMNIVYEGGRTLVSRSTMTAAGYGADSELNSTLLSSGEQKFDVLNVLENAAAGTSCLGETKSVLTGKSLNFIKDMAVIAPDTAGSRSYIKERAVILGKDARASLLPDMSIFENDVKASHSAAAAPIDRELIFYLMSRGLSEDDAVNMAATGFLADIIGRIGEGAAKAIIMSHVIEKLKSGRFGELIESNLMGVWEERPRSAASFFEGGAKYPMGSGIGNR